MAKAKPTGDYGDDGLNLAAHITGDPAAASAGATVQASALGAWGMIVMPILIVLALAWLFKSVRV